MDEWLKKLNISRGKALAILAIVIFFGFFLWGMKADAAEVRLGVGFGYASQAGARYEEIMLTSGDRHWYGAVTRIGGDDRHNYQYWRFTGGYRVNWRRGLKVSPYLRLGAAYFDDIPEDYISEHLAFDLAIGLRLWDVLEIELDQHNSTAGRSANNEGLDAATVSVVLPFGAR